MVYPANQGTRPSSKPYSREPGDQIQAIKAYVGDETDDASDTTLTGRVEALEASPGGGNYVEYADFASLPGTGTSGTFYVTLDNNKIYRWSGTQYNEVSATLALGETNVTAYRGDRGKTAYDHSQATTSVHGIADTSALYGAGGTDVAVADGGTGASTAAGARSNLDVDQAGTAAAFADHLNTSSAHDAENIDVADAAGHYTGTTVEEILAELAGGNGAEPDLLTVKRPPVGLSDRKALPNATNRGVIRTAVIGRTPTAETEQVKWKAFQANGNGPILPGNPLELSLAALRQLPWLTGGLVARLHMTGEAADDIKADCGTYTLASPDVFSDDGTTVGCVYWNQTYWDYVDDFYSKAAPLWDDNPDVAAIHFAGPQLGQYTEPMQRATTDQATLFSALDAGFNDAANRQAWTELLKIHAKHWKHTAALIAVTSYQIVSEVTTGGVTATATRSGSTVTVTTSAAHGLATNDPVFTQCAANSALNGNAGGGTAADEITITVTGSTTFTYTTATSGTQSSTAIRVGLVRFDDVASGEVMKECLDILGKDRCVFTNHSIRSQQVVSTKTISASARAGTLVTVTATSHGYSTGDSVTIDVATSSLNGVFDITVVNTNSFTYNTVASGTVATGGAGTARKNQKVSSVSGLTVTVSGTPFTADEHTFPTAVADRYALVVAGLGVGQCARITANGTNTFTVDRALTVDTTSRIEVFKSSDEVLSFNYRYNYDRMRALGAVYFGFQTSTQGNIGHEIPTMAWACRFGAVYVEVNTNYDSDPWDPTAMIEAASYLEQNAVAAEQRNGRILADSGTTTTSCSNASSRGRLTMSAVSISSGSRTDDVVTINTSADHHLKPGDLVLVDVTDATYDGQFTVLDTPTGTQFTYAQTAADDASAGTGSCVKDFTADEHNGQLLLITAAANDAAWQVRRVEDTVPAVSTSTPGYLVLRDQWTATGSNAISATPTQPVSYEVIDVSGVGDPAFAAAPVKIAHCWGSPEGVRYGAPGDVVVDDSTGKIWSKTSGTSNTGWTSQT